MDLATAANVAEVAGALTIAGGAAFALVQMREMKRQRQGAAAFTFIQQWDVERSRDLDLVYGLPDAAPPDLIEGDAAVKDAASSVYMNLEQLGLLVHSRIIPLATANDWAGGAVRVCWRKLKPWILHKRERTGSQRPGEWFQWPAERLAAHEGRDETVGAHAVYRDWKG